MGVPLPVLLGLGVCVCEVVGVTVGVGVVVGVGARHSVPPLAMQFTDMGNVNTHADCVMAPTVCAPFVEQL